MLGDRRHCQAPGARWPSLRRAFFRGIKMAMASDFYLRYYVGHKGKFGHEFLEFEFRPDGERKRGRHRLERGAGPGERGAEPAEEAGGASERTVGAEAAALAQINGSWRIQEAYIGFVNKR